MDELEQTVTRYLLGELPEQDQAALEKSYYSDPHVFDQVLQVESELVDAYARGQLSTEMRERFERSYLTHPSRRKRVKFARALTDRIDEREESLSRAEQPLNSALPVSWWQGLLATIGGRSPRLRFSMALVTLLVALAVVWIFVDSRRRQQQRETEQIQAQRESQKQQEREQTASQTSTGDKEERAARIPPETPEPPPKPTTSPAPPIVVLALTAGGVRGADGGTTQTLIIPHNTTQAQLLLNLKDNSYRRYRVTLQKIGGPEIFTQANIKPRSTKTGARFVFTLRTSQLNTGDYALTLGGITPEGEVDYLSKSLFRVEKR